MEPFPIKKNNFPPCESGMNKKDLANLPNNFSVKDHRKGKAQEEKDKTIPLPPISRSSSKPSSDPLIKEADLCQDWMGVDRKNIDTLNDMAMDDDQLCQWLRSSKPATALPKIRHSFM